MLLASTGLSVDVGYWYQEQESLQSAADTAAVAAALSDGVLAQTAASGKQTAAGPLATMAADGATDSQFGFAAGSHGSSVKISANITNTSSSGQSTVTTTQFTATAAIPRGSFFSSVSGVGVAGLVPGKQYASATSQTTSVYGPICLDATAPSGAGTIYTGNGGSTTGQTGFVGVNCGFYDNSTNCGGGTNDAIVDSNTPMVISATTIRTAGCSYSDFANGITPGLGSVAQKQTRVPDPYGSMDSSCTAAASSCMTWPATASVSGNATCLTGEMAMYFSGVSSKSSAECSNATNFPICTYSAKGYNPPFFTSCSLGSTIVNECEWTTTSDETCDTLANGVAGAASTTYYVGLFQSPPATQWNMNCASVSYTGSASAGNLKLICGAPANSTAETTDVFSDLDMDDEASGGTLDIATGNVVSTASSCSSAYDSNNEQCALIFKGTMLNIGGTFGASDNGTYTFTGGIYLDGSSTATENFYPGTYYISALSGDDDISNPTAGGAMLVARNDNVTFGAVSSGTTSSTALSTYYFNGGLNLQGNGHITFGPGIYYIENGDLIFGSDENVTVDGATFVFEGNAAYVMGADTQYTMTAPGVANTSYASTPCVAPSAFIAGATGGKGICGVLFYQARNDDAADSVSEGAGGSGKSNTIDGEIYAPSAPLTLTGEGSLTAGGSDTFGIVQYSFNSGTTGGKLEVEEPAGSPTSPIVGTTTAQPYLVK